MPYFHVPASDIFVLNSDKSIKKLTAEEVLSTTKQQSKRPVKNPVYVIFDNFEAAVKFANQGEAETIKDLQDQYKAAIAADPRDEDLIAGLKAQGGEDGILREFFPIFTGEVKDKDKLREVTVNANGEEVENGEFKAFEVSAKNFEFSSATFKYVKSEYLKDKDIEDFVYAKDVANAATSTPAPANSSGTEAPAVVTTSLMDKMKKFAPLVTTFVGGASFWVSGAVPGVAALLGKTLGVAIPVAGAAGMAVQFGIAAVAGVTVYAGLLATYTLGKAAINAASGAYARFKAPAAAPAANPEVAQNASPLVAQLGQALEAKPADATPVAAESPAADQPKALDTQATNTKAAQPTLAELAAANEAKVPVDEVAEARQKKGAKASK